MCVCVCAELLHTLNKGERISTSDFHNIISFRLLPFVHHIELLEHRPIIMDFHSSSQFSHSSSLLSLPISLSLLHSLRFSLYASTVYKRAHTNCSQENPLLLTYLCIYDIIYWWIASSFLCDLGKT